MFITTGSQLIYQERKLLNIKYYRLFEKRCQDYELELVIRVWTALEAQFRLYFAPNIDFKKSSWIQKPFSIGLNEIEHLQFAKLSNDSNLKLDFSKKPLTEFWNESRNEFPIISDLALNVLLPFTATYLCELTFSALTHTKSQNRSTLKNVEESLRPAASIIVPRFDLLCSKKQPYPSHWKTIWNHNQLTTFFF